MTTKIIFFDIDDTLSRNGVLANHNKETLKQLAKTDVKVVIATGRPKPMLPEDVLELFVDGVLDAIICTNGQYAFDSNKVISNYPLTIVEAERMEAIAREVNLVHKFDTLTHIAWAETANDTARIRKLIDNNDTFVVDPKVYQTQDVYQCSVFWGSLEAKDGEYTSPSLLHIKANIDKLLAVDFASDNLKLVKWSSIGGDIMPIDASKARAILDVCKYYNIDIKDSLAFGDGLNDIEMFDTVGISVAMGDAMDELKQHANQVTGTIEENGIQVMLASLGILDDAV